MAVRTIKSRDRGHHMMDQTSDAPKVAFVINLAQADSSSPNLARLRHLMHLLHGHRVAATWAVTDVLAGASSARLFARNVRRRICSDGR